MRLASRGAVVLRPVVLGVYLLVRPGAAFSSSHAASGGSAATLPDLLPSVKQVEESLGFPRTGNFLKSAAETHAAYRCYYTGKLELPESYDGLRLQQGTANGCRLDTTKYDVFFYPIEAVASGKTPVTGSLTHDSLERALVIVPHEDFHASRVLRKLPATIAEAASTLMGFLTAAEVARTNLGSDSEVARNLAQEADLFLRKAEIVNRSYARLSELYAEVGSGAVSPAEALAQKQEIFDELRQECQAILPLPHSFSRCVAAENNAGLAFDRTYTKYYPLVYHLYIAQARDVKSTAEALQETLAAGSESEALARLGARQAPPDEPRIAPLISHAAGRR